MIEAIFMMGGYKMKVRSASGCLGLGSRVEAVVLLIKVLKQRVLFASELEYLETGGITEKYRSAVTRLKR